jgi:hypothetical protein
MRFFEKSLINSRRDLIKRKGSVLIMKKRDILLKNVARLRLVVLARRIKNPRGEKRAKRNYRGDKERLLMGGIPIKSFSQWYD